MLTRAAAIAVLCWLCTGCANMVAPNGGKKDTRSPKVVKATPINGALNFKGTVIAIEFDKFIQPVDATKIYITPDLADKLKVKLSHKILYIKLKPPYRDSTTYTIHFNDVIADIRESNKLKDFEFVFSTGPVIDSLKVQGNIIDAFTGKPLKDIQVMLYDKTNDSIPLKQKPLYYTRTTENGDYTMTHIKAGTYKIFALEDRDGDLKYSQASERISFRDSVLNISHNIKGINMRLFTNTPAKQKLLHSGCPTTGQVFLKWALPVTQALHITCNESELFFAAHANTDSLTLYVKNVKTDSVKLYITDGNYADTTTVMMKTASSGGHGRFLLTLGHNLLCDRSRCLANDSLVINVNHPIASVDSSLITVIADTGKYKKTLPLHAKINMLAGTLTMRLPDVPRNNMYTCHVSKKAFTDIYGLTNADTMLLKFGKMSDEQKGNLVLTLNRNATDESYVLVVIKDNVRLTPNKTTLTTNRTVYTFNGLLPGTYTAYLVVDENHNGRWDSGDYFKHTQPEVVIPYQGNITMRANWDNDLKWNIK